MTDQRVDRITALVGAALAISYLLFARGIEDSLLADSVGANGVPMSVAGVMLLACVALFFKSWSKNEIKAIEPKDEQEAGGSEHPHRMALSLLALLTVYVALLPFLGYVVSIGLLVGSVAWLAGARKRVTVLMCMLTAGPVLWLLFDWALEIHLPVGLWPVLFNA